MSSVRRWYVLLVTTISLQAITWALILLIQNVLGVWGELDTETIAFQIAVLVIGGPVFLIHWLWAQRLANADQEERGAGLRCFFIYVNLALLFVPWLSNAYDLVQGLLGLVLAPSEHWYNNNSFPQQTIGQGIVGDLTSLLVLGMIWFYYHRVLQADTAIIPMSDTNALIRRIYRFGLTTIGLILAMDAGSSLLRWLFYQLSTMAASGGRITLIIPLTGLIIGLPLWIVPWQLVQQLFHGPDFAERESVLRKFYLHSVIFISALIAVSNATLLLTGVLRGLFGLEPQGDIRDVLPILLITIIIWIYHSLVLRTDTALIAEIPRQAGVRRLSWYLVASIGLAAALIGLGSIISVLIRAIGLPSFNDELREQLAWSIAALIAGLPIWIVIWRRAQGMAEASGPTGDNERGSLVRRIYLYGFLFLATLTILGGLIYIVFQLLRILLGEEPPSDFATDMAQAIAFSGIAAAVLTYHSLILRQEGRRRQAAEVQRATQMQIAVMDTGDGTFGRTLLERLRHEFPGLNLKPLGLTPAAAASMGTPSDAGSMTAQLNEITLIIGPWQVAFPHIVGSEIASAIGASPARKLLLPIPMEGWDWTGVEYWGGEAAIMHLIQALRQVISGEPVRPKTATSALVVIATIIAITVILFIILITIASFVSLG